MGQAELNGLLPPLQFGTRPGHNTTDSIHLMVHRIKGLWSKGQIISVLFMDVKGAFPSVDLDMLYRAYHRTVHGHGREFYGPCQPRYDRDRTVPLLLQALTWDGTVP